MNDQDDSRNDPGWEPEPDLPLDPDPPRDADGEPRPVWPWFAGLAIVVLVVGALLYVRRPVAPPVTQPAGVTGQAAATPAQAPQPAQLPQPIPPLGPAVEPVDLPPVDASDAAVRGLLKVLSGRPELAAWLASDGLIRTLAACIEAVAEGHSPALLLKPLAPRSPFTSAGGPGRVVAAPASFARYDGLAATVGAMDMQAVARLYSTLKPRLDEAYQELGHQPGSVDAAVARGLAHLLATPAAPADAALTQVVLSYHYTDEQLEGLSGAQKQVLRMGPRNAQIVRTKLRELAVALGVPADRLTMAR
jgi:hypothetical protein